MTTPKVRVYKNKSSKVTKTEEEPPQITVLEKFSPEVIHFDTKEEFTDHLAENAEEMNKMTTRKLNKAFRINGYRITKLKGVISLKSKSSEEKDIDESVLDEIHKKLDMIYNWITLMNLEKMTNHRS